MCHFSQSRDLKVSTPLPLSSTPSAHMIALSLDNWRVILMTADTLSNPPKNIDEHWAAIKNALFPGFRSFYSWSSAIWSDWLLNRGNGWMNEKDSKFHRLLHAMTSAYTVWNSEMFIVVCAVEKKTCCCARQESERYRRMQRFRKYSPNRIRIDIRSKYYANEKEHPVGWGLRIHSKPFLLAVRGD